MKGGVSLPKKILIIDDSALMRRVISDIIKSGNEYEVAAIAKDGLEGFEMIVSNPNEYSAIILDINMPKMNGLELLEKLQKNRIEQTVIVVSTVAKEGARETIKALELGAFDFVTKPENYLETKGEGFKQRIHEMLDVATSVRRKPVVRATAVSQPTIKPADDAATRAEQARASTLETLRLLRAARTENNTVNQNAPTVTTSRSSVVSSTAAVQTASVDTDRFKGVKSGKKKIIALACSTGGPKSLQQVVPLLPAKLDAPVVLVQHMPAGFTASLAQRLDEMSNVHVKEAEDKEVLQKGTVYIAPGGRHMRIEKSGKDYCIKLSDEPAIEGLRPCANLMYESLCHSDYDEITCVVLTGMGADGTKGIKELASRNKKIHVIAQDEDTCVVYGMPKAIAQSGLVNEVVPLGQVAEVISKNVGVS